MKLVDYIKKCLRNAKFKKCWEEENSDLDNILFKESITKISLNNSTIHEALKLLEEDDLKSIIDNKGIHPENVANTEIDFFEDKDKCPVKDFLESIVDDKLKAKTLRNIVELSIEGSNARPPLSSYVDDGIFELRTKQSSNIDRIFYFFIFGNKIILTNGYIKKSQKLDKKEFEKAKRYRDIYMSNLK